VNGVCVGAGKGQSCSDNDGVCDIGLLCNSNTQLCEAPTVAIGGSCTSDAECYSEYCVFSNSSNVGTCGIPYSLPVNSTCYNSGDCGAECYCNQAQYNTSGNCTLVPPSSLENCNPTPESSCSNPIESCTCNNNGAWQCLGPQATPPSVVTTLQGYFTCLNDNKGCLSNPTPSCCQSQVCEYLRVLYAQQVIFICGGQTAIDEFLTYAGCMISDSTAIEVISCSLTILVTLLYVLLL